MTETLQVSPPGDPHPDATFTLRLPERLIADLRAIARANERTASGEARRALAAHVQREREK